MKLKLLILLSVIKNAFAIHIKDALCIPLTTIHIKTQNPQSHAHVTNGPR